jgi:hypothetical protein
VLNARAAYLCGVKRLTAIVLSLCLFVQCTAQIAVLGLFELNKRYIAANLCENRAKPQLNCCGKCYLGKQLKKAGDDETPSGDAPAKTIRTEVPPCVMPVPLQSVVVAVEPSADVVRTPVVGQFTDRLSAASIFHPPAPRSLFHS